MLKGIVSAVLVFRLEIRQVPLDMGLVLLTWLRRPTTEIVLSQIGRRRHSADTRLFSKLDELYPF